MADTPTARLKLPLPAEVDPADVPVDLRKLAQALDDGTGGLGGGFGAAIVGQGKTSQMPSGHVKGRFYWDSDLSAMVYDDGAANHSITAPVVKALPANPADGYEIYLSVKDTQPIVMWHLRYNAFWTGWDFLGGPPLLSYRNDPVTGFGYTSWNGSYCPPAIQVPLAGAYDAEIGANVSYAGALGNNGAFSGAFYNYDASSAYADPLLIGLASAYSGGGGSFMAKARITLPKGIGLGNVYQTAAQSCNLGGRYFAITPVGGLS